MSCGAVLGAREQQQQQARRAANRDGARAGGKLPCSAHIVRRRFLVHGQHLRHRQFARVHASIA
jgi:hypothetical protein